MDGIKTIFCGLPSKISSALSNSKESQPLTLEELLDQPQPYEQIHRLIDHDKLLTMDPNNPILEHIQGSLIGLAIGDAVGASVEFRPHSYMKDYPVTDMQKGGTWGLKIGQWTDDTSMALCLAASLLVTKGFNSYDQLVRYNRWFRQGYLSSTGTCFDIGKSTREAMERFEIKQKKLGEKIEANYSDFSFDERCGSQDAAGNGSLMRLAPIPLFFWNKPEEAIENAEKSSKLTHQDRRAVDACRLYAAMIVRAVTGENKEKLLDPTTYRNYFEPALHPEINDILQGSYKHKRGYEDGILGVGFVVRSLEAALWAFANDENNFKKGVLLAVNLGDDTDTTAAIYGQLAGAHYGINGIEISWREKLFQEKFIRLIGTAIFLQSESTTPSSERKRALTNDGRTESEEKRPAQSDTPRLIVENE